MTPEQILSIIDRLDIKLSELRKELLKSGSGDSFKSTAKLPFGEVLPSSIKNVVRFRGMRVKDLAEHFKISISEVLQVIESPNSGLCIANRGWVK